MHSDAALYLMAGAVMLSALALVVGALAAVGLYRRVARLQEEISPLIPEARKTLVQAQQTLSDTARDVREIAAQTRLLLNKAEHQMQQIEETRVQVTTQLRVQGERVELVVEDILSRVQDVVTVVHGTVLKPVREVSGFVSGIKAAVQSLLLGRRPTVDRVTHDEEMFI